MSKNNARMPSTHVLSREPAPPDHTLYKLVDANGKVWGENLSHIEAKRLNSKLSSSHRCRTGKISPMDPAPTETAPPPATTPVVTEPPAGLMSAAGAAAASAAAAAQVRADRVAKQKAEDDAKRARIKELAAQVNAETAGDGEGSDDDVDMNDLLGDGDGMPSESDIKAAEDAVPHDATLRAADATDTAPKS